MRHANPRHVAEHAVQELSRLGYSQKQIASMAEVSEPTISKIRNDPDWPVSERLADRLNHALEKSRAELFSAIVCYLPVKVLETCNRQGAAVDEEVQSQTEHAISVALAHAYRHGAFTVNLPKGIGGALAVLGGSDDLISGSDGQRGALYLIATTGNKSDAQTLAHELEHLAQRLRAERPPEEGGNARPAF